MLIAVDSRFHGNDRGGYGNDLLICHSRESGSLVLFASVGPLLLCRDPNAIPILKRRFEHIFSNPVEIKHIKCF